MHLSRFKAKKMLLATALGVLPALLFSPAFASVTINEEQIKQAVIHHVEEALSHYITSQEDTQVNVEITNFPRRELVFPNATTFDLQVDSNLDRNYSERLVTRIDITTDDGQSQTLGVPVQIQVHKLVWVAKSAISAKTPLSPQDFTLESKDVGRQFAYVVGREYPLREYIARVNLMPGTILDNRKIVKPPDINRNSEVSIQFSNNNGMIISVTGTALNDGNIGEVIKVRQSIYKNRYHNARVIDKNRVQVDI
ncbi:MAG: flagellar basal body P-ring formation chaperone FlgA [Vampirovibrionales bacterium]|nr:flagellar basal body P-ring formation chaperone FlgA [Vampirovibrionales bacterium]